jgi:hypothetical protein
MGASGIDHSDRALRNDVAWRRFRVARRPAASVLVFYLNSVAGQKGTSATGEEMWTKRVGVSSQTRTDDSFNN